ncbi:hypothetical protein BIW11_04528 [Tropilaelaps mercedesae]|uniref:Uncharacterized protein n=1 Tax=Tropilaelaps mercedesae TaxID=418985 RepID=A0A1V9X5F5_9ACAR|nr:hypothetical protein BIW11_04528 [Tropilaelaps mercedesae]
MCSTSQRVSALLEPSFLDYLQAPKSSHGQRKKTMKNPSTELSNDEDYFEGSRPDQ